MRSFLNRKRLSYFILQDIPDLFSNLKCLNMQLYIWRWYIICMCKISVQIDIIKDILKKKTDVHWISDGTACYMSIAAQFENSWSRDSLHLKWLSWNCLKRNTDYSEDYSQTSCTYSALDETPAKFQKDPAKSVGGFAFMTNAEGKTKSPDPDLKLSTL